MNLRPLLSCLGMSGGALLFFSSCLFEADIVEMLNGDPTPTPAPTPIEVKPGVVNIIIGQDTGIANEPTIHMFSAFGEEIAVTQEPTEGGAAYLVSAEDSTAMLGLVVRVAAVSGNIVVKGALPCLTQEALDAGVTLELDKASTTAALVVEALGALRWNIRESISISNYAMSPYAYSLETLATDEVGFVYDSALESIASGTGAYADLAGVVGAVIDAGDEASEGTTMFPLAADSTALVQDAFFAENSVDLDGDGSPDPNSGNFNGVALGLASEAWLTATDNVLPLLYTDKDGNTYPYLTTVFTAHMEAGTCITAESACAGKWINCDDGDALYFTGGTHEDSPIQDTSVDAQMGNWKPNIVPMYDDGTHGDLVAEDGIWTITYQLPASLRIGYKYTYGKYQEAWTGTEEWPGNQRILEILDNNGDGIVWRDDNVTAEDTNKDKNNCHPSFGGCKGTLTWETDLNGDGIPEAQEHPLSLEVVDAEAGLVDLAGQCTYDAWVHHPFLTRMTEEACE